MWCSSPGALARSCWHDMRPMPMKLKHLKVCCKDKPGLGASFTRSCSPGQARMALVTPLYQTPCCAGHGLANSTISQCMFAHDPESSTGTSRVSLHSALAARVDLLTCQTGLWQQDLQGRQPLAAGILNTQNALIMLTVGSRPTDAATSVVSL